MNQIDDLMKVYQEENIKRIKLAFIDMDGVHRGKYVSIEKFEGILKDGGGFCDCVLGWDINDQLYDNAQYTGWHTAFPDAQYKVDLTSERRLKDENNTPLFLIDFVDEEGGLHPICPRSVFKRVLRQADQMGYSVQLAFEYEFFVFNETSQSVRDKGYQNLTPISPGNFGYSLLRTNVFSDLFHEFQDYCDDLGIEIEGIHCETGSGVWEAALRYCDAQEAVDRAALFKTFTKSFFQKRGMIVTFMAKWSMDFPGQSGHIHQSLLNRDGKNVFFDQDGEHLMSSQMKHYLAGQVEYLKELLPMCAPSINSYTRLVKGAWAPTTSSWGVENRTTSFRVIPGSEKSQRVEFRLGSADANPYLAAAAMLGAGLAGIKDSLDLPARMTGNAYEQEDGLDEHYQLSSNLRDATRCFKSSKKAIEILGEEFVEHFTASRLWEVREYEKQVTQWQLDRYFEII